MARAPTEPIRVLVVDPHRSSGEALQLALSDAPDLEVVEVVADGDAAVRAAARRRPDVVLIDLERPASALEATRRIRDRVEGAGVILFAEDDDPLTLARALRAGASGCVRKTDGVGDLADAVRRAARGEPVRGEVLAERSALGPRRRSAGPDQLGERVERLTPRELEILREAALGRRNDDIARALGMSRHTVRTHVQNILTKLGVHSKLEAVLVAIRYGKVAPLAPVGRERGTTPPYP